MGQIPVAAAARALGLSERGLRTMIRAGRLRDASRAGQPAAVREDDVTRLLLERQAEASRRQPDAVAFAHQVRRVLWPDEAWERIELADGRVQVLKPPDPYNGPRPAKNYGQAALRTLNPDAVALFGRAAVETAAMERDVWRTSCRWCFADASAKALGGLRPVDSPAYAALLGSEPCPKDRARWAQEAAEHRAAVKRRRDAQTARERQAAQDRARRDFTASQGALRAAEQRHAAALRTLAQTDLPTAVRAAGEAVRRGPGSLPCGCTYSTYCPAHAAVFGTSDRSVSRR